MRSIAKTITERGKDIFVTNQEEKDLKQGVPKGKCNCQRTSGVPLRLLERTD